jgi:sugar phosphate isomerase/epimerase
MPWLGMAGVSVMLMPALDALRKAIELGFQAFEISGEFPQCVCEEMTAAQRREGKAMVESSGLALALHAPFNSLNPAALNPGVRAESIRQTLAAIDLCADLGGRVVIVHNGNYILSENFWKTSPEAFRLQWDYNIQALQQGARRAQEKGVVLGLENIESNCIDRNADDMLKIKEEVDSSALAFCIDIGHARLNRELPQVIEKLGPLARHIHFTDNFGEKDDHLVIGQGNFDYSPHLDFFRSFTGIITLEVISIGTD